MTDPQLVPRLRAWLRSTDEAPEDVRRSATIVAARLEGERQRGRWWPLPSPRRSTATQEGRRSMSSLVQFMAASVIALTIGGAVFISQPVGQPSGLSGAGADAGPAAPVAFTGRIAFGPGVRFGTYETVDGHGESRGSVHAPGVMNISDPRLDGKVLISWQTNTWVAPGGTELVLGTGTWRIATDEGAWQGSYHRVEAEGFSDTSTAVLYGEGAYEGLVVAWEQTIDGSGWDVRGVIFPGSPPPPAELP